MAGEAMGVASVGDASAMRRVQIGGADVAERNIAASLFILGFVLDSVAAFENPPSLRHACIAIIVYSFCWQVTKRHPLVVALLLIGAYWVQACATYADFTYLVGAMLVGWCVMFRYARFAVAITIWVAGICMECLFSMLIGSSAGLLFPHIVHEILAACAGLVWALAWQWGERREYEREVCRLRRQVALAQRDAVVASRIHDGLSNDLSYIITLAEMPRQAGMQADRGLTLSAIGERARVAFEGAHGVIRMLRGECPQEDMWQMSLFERTVSDVLLRLQGELRDFGICGTVDIHRCVDGTYIDSRVGAQIVSLLLELGANMRKYCPPGERRYSLDVIFDGPSIRILQSNPIVPADKTSAMLSNGAGLRLQRSIIADMHGILRYGVEDGMWNLHAVLPSSLALERKDEESS